MAQIVKLRIENFRKYKQASFNFGTQNLIAFIGRGDSGKTTILEAIKTALSPQWNLGFYDHDFYNSDTSRPIIIQVTLVNLPEKLLREEKFGLHKRFYLTLSEKIIDQIEEIDGEEYFEALTIECRIDKDLQPEWNIVNGRDQENVPIRHTDRMLFGLFSLSDFTDNQLSWSKHGPLSRLLRKNEPDNIKISETLIGEAMRVVRDKLDNEKFPHLLSDIETLKKTCIQFGLDIGNPNVTIDFKHLKLSESHISLHDSTIPFRLKGKGSKRIISISMQYLIAQEGGIILIDEIEQGLEPDRVQHIVSQLNKAGKNGQIFLTTHSQNVITELSHENLHRISKEAPHQVSFNLDLQGSIRAHPYVFFGKKVLVCQGATEAGIVRALNSYRVGKEQKSLAILGVTFADAGGGSNVKNRALAFAESKYDTAVLCDSDGQPNTTDKEEMASKGIPIFDCKEGLYIEQQILNEIPWKGVLDILNLVYEIKGKDEVAQSISSGLSESFNPDTPGEDNSEIRSVIGKRSGKNKWFKNVTDGEKLGDILFAHIDQLNPESHLAQILAGLNYWIDA